MNHEVLADFPISPDLVMLNHASFGMPTTGVMRLAERTRAELEADSLALIDVAALTPRLRAAATAGARQLGLDPGCFALTHNATSGAAAVMRSLRLAPGDRVVVLSTEYPSITRGWQVRCEEADARFVPVAVPVPLGSTEQLLDAVAQHVDGDVAVAQLSLVTSSTAMHLPVAEVASWFKARGATVVVDAAHGPGHVPLRPEVWGCDAMFGTLHKWFPTPRPVGFLWTSERLRDVVRPAEVSLTWDASDLVERFSWTGTYDPTPRLCLEAALAQWNAWERAGELDRCAELAEYAMSRLRTAGATPTAGDSLQPPRLRAAVLGGVARDTLAEALLASKLRCFSGLGPSGETIVRVATHVYNDESDVDRLCEVVADCLS